MMKCYCCQTNGECDATQVRTTSNSIIDDILIAAADLPNRAARIKAAIVLSIFDPFKRGIVVSTIEELEKAGLP